MLNWLKKRFPSNIKNQGSLSWNDPGYPSEALAGVLFSQLESSSGVRVSPLRALGVAAVYSCINVLSRTVASLPLRLYEHGEDGRTKRLVTDHKLCGLIGSGPNPEMTIYEFLVAMQTNLSMRNNAYAHIVRDRLGRVAGLEPLVPYEVNKQRGNDGRIVYQVRGKMLERHEIMHIRNMSINGLLGIDLLAASNDVIGLAIALETNAAKFFANNSQLGTVIEHPGKLGTEAYNRLKTDLERQHGGVENAHRIKILEEGMRMAANRSTNRDSQFEEARERQDKQICRLFNVPPHKVQILSDATYSNIESQNTQFATDTIVPIIRNWEAALNKALLSKQEQGRYFFKFDISELTRGDTATRSDFYARGIQWGYLSPNEVRTMENLNPRENGDVYLQPVNMIESNNQPPPKDEN